MDSQQMNPYDSPREPEPPATPQGVGVRWGVLLFLCTLSLLLYIDRICIGQAETSIRDELGLEKWHMGWVFSAFMLAYCLFEVPTGHWGDRFGSRGVIARIVVWWSIFTALTGAAFGFSSLVAIRFLFGAGEAGAFPNAARVVTRWFPPGERGFARGAITTTSMLGGAIAPPLAAALINAAGWRATFAIFGVLGLFWAAAFYWWFRDDPAQHAAMTAGELQRIGAAAKQSGGGEHGAIPWSAVLTNPNVWLLGTIMTVGATLFYTQFQWFSTYLKEARGLSEQQSSLCTGAVISGGAAGCMVGGLVADWVTRRFTDRKLARRLCGATMLLLAFLSLWCLRYSQSVIAATGLNAAALFCLQVSLPTWWTVVAEISGRHGAAMFGLMNGLGGLGVMAMNFFVGRIVDARQAAGYALIDCWRPVFDGVAIGLAVGAMCWMLVDVTRVIVPPEVTNPQREQG
jgi:MFS transporter, ACS family, glucarate transporter